MKNKLIWSALLIALLVMTSVFVTHAWTAVPVTDDPLVRMPGTQPRQVLLEGPNNCLNCHSGYNTAVEPGFNWSGSMMAQAARDFVYFSCLTVGLQDSIWAAGRPNAGDICERCHFPKGWLEGRSDPPNASAMTMADYDGVQCDFCHSMWDPFFETTYAGTREGAGWLGYWDETNASGTPSQPAADATYAEDMSYTPSILKFNGDGFFTNNLPPVAYTENATGQYFVSPNNAKRASFADANARHVVQYSRYHKSKYMCGTCHDVSNPVLANLGADPTQPLPTEENSSYAYFHVERTFSEFMLSDYGQQGGAATNVEFQEQGAPDITHAAKCQDCHMRDVAGRAARMQMAVTRPSQSIEHPQSGQPLHDLTGGNAWVSFVLASTVPGSANYDPLNEQLLNQGPAVLTLDLTQGVGVDAAALLAGVDRAKQQLLLAATIKNLTYDPTIGELSFQVQNNGAHRLISGFPEGRRMFINVKAFDAAGNVIYEVNPYDAAAGTLKGLTYPYQPGMGLPDPLPLTTSEIYVDELVYEMKPSSSDKVPNTQGVGLTGEYKTFHFALATGRYKDNRIPPKGFDAANAALRSAETVYTTKLPDGTFVDTGSTYYTDAEYAGGYDEVVLTLPVVADLVQVNLYYQTTSREYMEFLRDEIKGTGNLTLSSPTPSGEPDAYVVQTDPFFGQLKAWGDTIWQLWTHNMNVDGAVPFLMAQAQVAAEPPPPACGVTAPALNTATSGNMEVALDWSAVTGATGYNVYYDQAGKAQLVADAGNTTTFIDAGLTNGVEYCYKVTAYDATCESGYSNIVCAIPNSVGLATDPAGVNPLETGLYVGPGPVFTFSPQSAFNAGAEVVFRAHVVDNLTGLPLPGATVDLLITGPETLTLVTGLSDANGVAEAAWRTARPTRRNPGTTPGAYTVQVKGVTATGYHWDGVTTSANFTIQ
jgi:hypothetical protein